MGNLKLHIHSVAADQARVKEAGDPIQKEMRMMRMKGHKTRSSMAKLGLMMDRMYV